MSARYKPPPRWRRPKKPKTEAKVIRITVDKKDFRDVEDSDFSSDEDLIFLPNGQAAVKSQLTPSAINQIASINTQDESSSDDDFLRATKKRKVSKQRESNRAEPKTSIPESSKPSGSNENTIENARPQIDQLISEKDLVSASLSPSLTSLPSRPSSNTSILPLPSESTSSADSKKLEQSEAEPEIKWKAPAAVLPGSLAPYVSHKPPSAPYKRARSPSTGEVIVSTPRNDPQPTVNHGPRKFRAPDDESSDSDSYVTHVVGHIGRSPPSHGAAHPYKPTVFADRGKFRAPDDESSDSEGFARPVARLLAPSSTRTVGNSYAARNVSPARPGRFQSADDNLSDSESNSRSAAYHSFTRSTTNDLKPLSGWQSAKSPWAKPNESEDLNGEISDSDGRSRPTAYSVPARPASSSTKLLPTSTSRQPVQAVSSKPGRFKVPDEESPDSDSYSPPTSTCEPANKVAQRPPTSTSWQPVQAAPSKPNHFRGPTEESSNPGSYSPLASTQAFNVAVPLWSDSTPLQNDKSNDRDAEIKSDKYLRSSVWNTNSRSASEMSRPGSSATRTTRPLPSVKSSRFRNPDEEWSDSESYYRSSNSISPPPAARYGNSSQPTRFKGADEEPSDSDTDHLRRTEQAQRPLAFVAALAKRGSSSIDQSQNLSASQLTSQTKKNVPSSRFQAPDEFFSKLDRHAVPSWTFQQPRPTLFKSGHRQQLPPALPIASQRQNSTTERIKTSPPPQVSNSDLSREASTTRRPTRFDVKNPTDLNKSRKVSDVHDRSFLSERISSSSVGKDPARLTVAQDSSDLVKIEPQDDWTIKVEERSRPPVGAARSTDESNMAEDVMAKLGQAVNINGFDLYSLMSKDSFFADVSKLITPTDTRKSSDPRLKLEDATIKTETPSEEDGLHLEPEVQTRERRRTVRRVTLRESETVKSESIKSEPNISGYIDPDFEEFDAYDETLELAQVSRAINHDTYDTARPKSRLRQARAVVDLNEDLIRTLKTVSDPLQRRPYLPANSRSFLRSVRFWDEFKNYRGMTIHVDFLPWEYDMLVGALKGKTTLTKLAALLPGRTVHDLVRFIEDGMHFEDKPSFIIVPTEGQFQSTSGVKMPFLATREIARGRTPQKAFDDAMLRRFHTIRTSTSGSGETLSIAFSHDGKYFAIGNTASEDQYNREGNLICGQVDTGDIHLLDKHKKIKENTQEALFCTVSSVRFSKVGNFLYSAGYDGVVRSWNAGTRRTIDKLDVGHVTVMNNFMSRNQEFILSGNSKGMTYLIGVNDDHSFGSRQPIKPLSKKSPSVSCMDLLGSHKAVIGYEQQSLNGSLNGFAVVHDFESKATTKLPVDAFYSDVCSHNTLPYFAISNTTGSGKSHFRLFNYGNGSEALPRENLSFVTPQKDVNKITMSHDLILGTTSGTDGNTYVWDFRYTAKHLYCLSHGTSKATLDEDLPVDEADYGVECALWVPRHSRHLVTGSSDGCVKLWDLRSGNCVGDLLETQNGIMTAEFSPSGDDLFVGDVSGLIYQLSQVGSTPDNVQNFKIVRSVKHMSARTEGVDAANSLLESGMARVVTNTHGERSVWAF
ncbi:hypothetical protein V1512DRAFT_241532 [Lipomyces arxii]|uniref:uncharacterized protein n=1 Tax=Lipomyces arxii TaxID=56418 RepID=UPI0034D01B1A